MNKIKKNNNISNVSRIVALVLASASFLTACSAQAAENEADNKSADGAESVQKIIVGTGNGYEPYCYLDENGELAGYEYGVLKEVDKLVDRWD